MRGKGFNKIWLWLERFVERRWAVGAIAAATALALIGFVVSLNLKIGDLDPGAPELRPDSRYNRDNAYITANYSLSSDQFAVIVKTEKEGCLKYADADRGGSTDLGAAAGAGRADHGGADQCRASNYRRYLRRQSKVADDRAQPGRAELRRAAGERQQPGSV